MNGKKSDLISNTLGDLRYILSVPSMVLSSRIEVIEPVTHDSQTLQKART